MVFMMIWGMSNRESNVDIVMFAVGKSSVALFASCHSAVGMSPFLLVRSFDLVWIMMCSTPENFPLERCSMAFSTVGLQSFTDFFLWEQTFSSLMQFSDLILLLEDQSMVLVFHLVI